MKELIDMDIKDIQKINKENLLSDAEILTTYLNIKEQLICAAKQPNRIGISIYASEYTSKLYEIINILKMDGFKITIDAYRIDINWF